MLRRLFATRPRALAMTGVSLMVGVLSILLLLTDSPLVRMSYDAGFQFRSSTRPSLSNSPVVIVYLDEESYERERQVPSEPWSRALHTRLLQRLTRAQARAVVFDVLFDAEGKDAAVDREFENAIRANGRVILAGAVNHWSHKPGEGEWHRFANITLPREPFLKAAAGWGIADSIIDEDFVVRRHFPNTAPSQPTSLAWAVARLLDWPAAQRPENGRAWWLRYYGAPITIPHVSYSTALNPDGISDDFFRDKIVVIGARPKVGGFAERKDEYRSPFSSWGDKELFMPAVEVHATQILNLAQGDWLRRWPLEAEAGLLLVSAFVCAWALFRFRPVLATGVALLAEGVVFGLIAFAFTKHRLWFPWLLVSAVQIPAALAGSALFQTLDWIRQKRRFEAQRREAAQKIAEQAALIDKAQDAILVQDLQGRIVYANPSAERLYGWKLTELQSDGIAKRLFPRVGSRAVEARDAVLEKNEWLGELEQATRTEQKLIVESRWTLIRDEQGRPKSILLINTDVTEKKRLEAQFLATQRLETIGSMAGGMAHDLNNALSPILMGLQLLRKREQDEETGRMLAVMEENTHRGADMVKQVLLFARGQDGDKELVDVGALLREMGRIVRQTFPKSINVAVLAPRDIWPVLGNPTQLHQVLLNLCVNARDAMRSSERGGELTLAADNVELTADEAKEIPHGVPGQFVMLVVADSGSGIASKVLPRIFEPFFSTKPAAEGTGLGLSITARMVASHSGFIHVKSEVGVGTTFEVYLPRAAARQSVLTPGVPADLPRGQGELILLIDDEQSVRDLLTPSLTEQGYRVLAAASGAEGLTLLKENPTEVRLALLDLAMPGMDGPLTLAALRGVRSGLPVVLMSGELEPQAAEQFTREGGTAFLAKPFALETLVQAISRILQEEASRDRK